MFGVRKNIASLLELFKISQRMFFLFLLALFFFCFSISLILLDVLNVRPIIYYGITTFLATSILLEILLFNSTKNKPAIILLQIMMLALNITWGVSLKYFYFIGRTDPLVHAWFIDNLINHGNITDVFGVYKPFPLWHILCCFLYKIFAIPVSAHRIMFFINGIIYSFLIPLVYLISLKLFKNKNLSLLHSLFLCFLPIFIYSGMSSIARDVVSFFEIMLILLLLDNKDVKKRAFAIFLTFIIIVYHTVSMPFIISIFLLIYGLQRIYQIDKEKRFLTFNYILLATTMTLAYWVYCADNLFQMIINNVFSSSPTGTLTKSIIYTPQSELFNYLQYTPLLFFLITGTLFALNLKKFAVQSKIFCLTGLLTAAVTFPGPSLLLNKLASNFNLERFEEYTFLFISMSGAVGFLEMFNRGKKYFKFFLVLLFSIMCFLSISNDFTASDNPLVKRPFYTYYLTEEEIIAFNHNANIATDYLMSDYVTTRYLMASPYTFKSHILEVDENNKNFLRNKDKDIFLIRIKELQKRPLKLYSSENSTFKLNPTWYPLLYYYLHDYILWNSLTKYNKIYNSGRVESFS